MIENVLNRMGGVGVYGVISICLFFAVFVGVLVWTIRLKKPYLKAMRELPLEGESAHGTRTLNQPPTLKIAMTENNDPLLLDHEADGIRELDNKLPRWWVWLFYCTIIFAVVYLVVLPRLCAGDLDDGQLNTRQGDEGGRRHQTAAMAKFESDIATLQPSKDPDVLARRQEDVSHVVRAVPPPGRRRVGRAEPDGRLLDPRQQLH